MKKFLHLLLVITLFTLTIFSQEKSHSQLNITCKTCHGCEVPTKDDPCLIACPRFSMIKEYPSPEAGPDVIVINELEDRYTPVIFSHKLHAQMSEMTGGCSGCHHYNTLGPILSCNNCHSRKRKRDDVRTPDMKAAFHQQCLNCHRQWSRQTECNSCHKEKSKEENLELDKVTSELMKKSHPPVTVPTKIVYQTDCEKGKLVTFYHNDHSVKFELECISCHKNENCIRCHDVKKNGNGVNETYDSQVKINQPEEERHNRCFGCHENDECTFCHKNKEMNSFDHKVSTGWALTVYHQELSCRKCHQDKTNYSNVNKECNKCHYDWNPKTFDHKITGLILDENHIDNDCQDCHINKDFGSRPTCDSCHEGMNYPKDIPGKIKKRNKET